jgi:hypothetical protein
MVTLTLAEAQQSLKFLAERVLLGEAVFIRIEGTEELLSLQSVPSELPPNYLAECYGSEEIAEEEYLAGLAPRGLAT